MHRPEPRPRRLLRPALSALPLLALGALLAGCEPDAGDGSSDANLAPQTHVSVGFFRADSSLQDTLGLTASRVGLAWWGEDADGWIDHYRWRWEGDAQWQETEQESDTFVVRLTQELMTVRFEVQAVDNLGLSDPTPAAMVFPAYNQKPRLDWVAQSQQIVDLAFDGDTAWTFPWNTFHFNVWDLDGNETVEELRWALDDTTAWESLELGLGAIELGPDRLTPGPHRVFVQARDIARAWSDPLVYPSDADTTSDGVPQVWMVRPAIGDLLLVFDDPAEATTGPPLIRAGLEGMGYVEDADYSFWDVTGWLPYDDRDFIDLLGGFEMVFWCSWKVDQLENACTPLDQYMVAGGKTLVSTAQVGYWSTSLNLPILYDELCLPIDSLTNQRPRIVGDGLADQPILPTAEFASRYPELHVSGNVNLSWQGGGNGSGNLNFGFVPDDSSSVELYYAAEVPGDSRYPRTTVAARRPADHDPNKAKQVYMSIPIQKLDDLPGFFNTLIHDEFDW